MTAWPSYRAMCETILEANLVTHKDGTPFNSGEELFNACRELSIINFELYPRALRVLNRDAEADALLQWVEDSLKTIDPNP